MFRASEVKNGQNWGRRGNTLAIDPLLDGIKKTHRDEIRYDEYEKSPGAIRAERIIKNDSEFVPGEVTLRLKSDRYKIFEKAIDIYSAEKLCDIIKLNCNKSNVEQFENAYETLSLTYGSVKRKNGVNDAISHPLRVAAFGASLGAPFGFLVKCLFHDIPEITDELKKFGVKFRTRIGNEIREFETKEDILKHIKSAYGEEIAEDVLVLTNKERKGKTRREQQQGYVNYTENLYNYKRVDPAVIKAIDIDMTLLEIVFTKDEKKMRRQIDNTVFKIVCQFEKLKKISLLLSELLRLGLENYANYIRYDELERKLRQPTLSDIKKFAKGWTKNGERKYSKELLKGVSLSGSPVIDTYLIAENEFEIEIPFVDKLMAFRLIDVFGNDVIQNCEIVRSLLPTHLSNAVLLRLKGNYDEATRLMPDLVKAYDSELKAGNILQQFKAFDRLEFTKMALNEYNLSVHFSQKLSLDEVLSPGKNEGGGRRKAFFFNLF